MMDEGGGEMTTIAINEENSSAQTLIDAFKTGDFTIFTNELEKVILTSPIEVFESFLNNFSGTEIDLKINDSNLLHILIKLLPEIDFEKTSECVKIALNYGLDINEPDDKNQTPFFYFLKFQPKFPNNELFNFILDNFDVDFYNFKGDKMQQMFEKQNPGRKIPQKIDKKLNFGFLVSKLNKENYSEFLENFKTFKNSQKVSQNGILVNLNENNNENLKEQKICEMSSKFQDQCANFLHAAVKRGLDDVTKLLIDEGIEVDRLPNSQKNSKTSTFIAASYGYHKVLKELLKVHPSLIDLKGGNILHTILHANYQNTSKNPKVDYQKCFELVLPHCNVNQVDEIQQTPLHYAVKHRNNFAVLELLKNGADLTMKNIFDETPMEDMGREVFEEFLDERISLIQVPEDKEQKEVTIGIDLKFLANKPSEVEALELISKNPETRPLIQHPVLSSFIFLKWTRFSFLFFSNFFIFTFLIAALIGFLIMCHSNIEEGKIFLKFLSILGVFLLFIRELLQFILLTIAKVCYFKNPVNLIEIALIIFGFLSLLPENNFNEEIWKIIRAVTIILAFCEIWNLFGDLPYLAISTSFEIFKRVAWSYFKSMLLYFIPIIAFALSFFVLYGGQNNQNNEIKNNSTTSESDDPEKQFNRFTYLPTALLKVVAMGIGEFEASNLDLTAKHFFYSLIFLTFVFSISIVLFNVLSALAVDDIQKIKAEGELINLISRIKVLSRYEKITNSKFLNFAPFWRKMKNFVNVFNNFEDGKVIVAPNKKFAILTSKNGKLEGEGCFGNKSKKCLMSCNKLDYKIGKKLRNVIEERKIKKLREENENEIKNELRELKKLILKLK